MRTFTQKLLGAAIGLASIASLAAAQVNAVEFDLLPNPKFLSCLAAPGGPTPTAHVTVTRGKFNDRLTIEGNNLKPGLAFDMFTVENTNLLASGAPDTNFVTFGMAHYQSDLRANELGHFKTTIKGVLLDDAFDVDPLAGVKPTNTFHLGFWFDNPNDANVNGCTFDVTKPTPFNGEHKAGPIAMISVPSDANLGPLCTNPNLTTDPATCTP